MYESQDSGNRGGGSESETWESSALESAVRQEEKREKRKAKSRTLGYRYLSGKHVRGIWGRKLERTGQRSRRKEYEDREAKARKSLENMGIVLLPKC